MDLGHRQRKFELHTEDRKMGRGSRLIDRGGLRSKYGEGGVLLHQRQPTEITPVSGSRLLQYPMSLSDNLTPVSPD